MYIDDFAIFILHICIAFLINRSLFDDIRYVFFPYLSSILLLSINQLIIFYLIACLFPDKTLYKAILLLIHLLCLIGILKLKIKIFYFKWFETVEGGCQKETIIKKEKVFIAILFSITLLLFATLGYLRYFGSNPIEKYILIILNIYIYILVLFYFEKSLKFSMVSIEAITDKTYRKEIESYMKVIRAQRHDFNFHLHAIQGMIENGKVSECHKYIQEMVKSSISLNDIIGVYDPAIGAMLNIFRENALIKGIKIDFDIKYNMEHIGCSSYEANKIIGNLLQNALDETERHKDLSYGIKLLIFKRSGNTVIDVSNIFSGNEGVLADIFQYGYSTKPDHDGIGLSNVSNILELRGGMIYTEFEENIIHFVVTVPNRYAKRPA